MDVSKTLNIWIVLCKIIAMILAINVCFFEAFNFINEANSVFVLFGIFLILIAFLLIFTTVVYIYKLVNKEIKKIIGGNE